MNADSDLQEHTKKFALRIIRLYSALPRTTLGQVIGRQVLRSGTSVGAQYRECCRARSPAEFVSKIESALQELEETAYWLELIVESGLKESRLLDDIRDEANQLSAMLAASAITAKRNRK